MKTATSRERRVDPRKRQSGQTMTLVLLVLGLFFLGAIGLSVDVSNWWFHRQLAQGAADAACTAGVMDMLLNATGGSASGWPLGSPPASFACSGAASTSAPCRYAAINGFNGSGRLAGQPSNDVLVSFPASVPGVGTCGNPPVPPCIAGPNSIIQVDVFDRVPTTFTGLVGGGRTRDIISSARCGILQDTSPVPIIVLNPTCPHAFQLNGTADVKIVGGPPRSVQVNSSNDSCAAATTNAPNGCNSGGPTIDLSKGGPSFSGSDFGVTGQPKTPPPGFIGANWATAAPISDPFANVPAPAIPALSPTNGIANARATAQANVKYGVDGCPDQNGPSVTSTNQCVEFEPGLYTNPIEVKGITAIFKPGLYYIQGVDNANRSDPGTGCVPPPTGQGRYGLIVDSGGVVRPSTATGDGSRGVTFYFSGAGGSGTYGSVFFGSNAGTSGGRTIDPYVTANAVCPGAPPPPPELGLPATVNGNVMLGPCTSHGTYTGAPNETPGTVRGLLFFQDRANADAKGQASMQGGGGLVISGNMYFHNCNSSGTGTNCTAPAGGYNAFFNLQGTPGGNAYVLGNITTDELVMGGNGNISMALNPNAVYNILKASLLQ